MTTSTPRLPRTELSPTSFAHWREVMCQSPLPPEQRWLLATEIQRFLKYCDILGLPVGWSQAREYLAIVPLVCARPHARQALRWFFSHARRDHFARPPAIEPFVSWAHPGDGDVSSDFDCCTAPANAGTSGAEPDY